MVTKTSSISPSSEETVPKCTVCEFLSFSGLEKIASVTSKDLSPERRITPIAPTPFAVANAQIVS